MALVIFQIRSFSADASSAYYIHIYNGNKKDEVLMFVQIV